jgi:hypothetical protein
MFARRARDRDVVVDRGVSLARGPVLFAGAVLFAYGLLGFLTNSDLPRDQFADGTVQGQSWLGLEVNGWTCFFITAAGGLLLFGAATHLLARVMALIVGGLLAACCVIALIDGSDVLGLAAVNWATKVGFGAAAVYLLIAGLLPRAGRRVIAPDQRRGDEIGEEPTAVAAQPVIEREPEPAGDEEATRVVEADELTRR